MQPYNVDLSSLIVTFFSQPTCQILKIERTCLYLAIIIAPPFVNHDHLHVMYMYVNYRYIMIEGYRNNSI